MIHISKIITTTVKPSNKLVPYEVLLTSSPTNMTSTLWKSVKVAWPNFRLSLLARTAFINQIYMSDRIVAHTVIPMTLAYFRDNDAHWRKNSKAHISETITPIAMLSCTVIELGMVFLQGRWNRWPWPSHKKVKTLWSTFRFSGSITPMPWARTTVLERSYWRMAGARQLLQSLFFGRPWPTFATVTHI